MSKKFQIIGNLTTKQLPTLFVGLEHTFAAGNQKPRSLTPLSHFDSQCVGGHGEHMVPLIHLIPHTSDTV